MPRPPADLLARRSAICRQLEAQRAALRSEAPASRGPLWLGAWAAERPFVLLAAAAGSGVLAALVLAKALPKTLVGVVIPWLVVEVHAAARRLLHLGTRAVFGARSPG
jgi:hypothetical protein